MEQLITKSRYCLGLPSLDDNELQAAGVAWLEILGDIPLEYLNLCYLRAIKNRRENSPFGADQILAVWMKFRNSDEYREMVRRQRGVTLVLDVGRPTPAELSQIVERVKKECPDLGPKLFKSKEWPKDPPPMNTVELVLRKRQVLQAAAAYIARETGQPAPVETSTSKQPDIETRADQGEA